MDRSLVADGDKFMVVTLTGVVDGQEKHADLPVGQLPLHDIQVNLGDGRTVHVKHAAGLALIQITDLKGEVIGEMAVPAQKPELAAASQRIRKAAERLTERLTEAIEEAAATVQDVESAEQFGLPEIIPLPGPAKLN